MKEPQSSSLEQLADEANQALAESQTILQELVDDSTLITLPEDSSMSRAQILQLILQYRLDSQDALAKLLQLEHGVLQALGIAPQQSSKINLERMMYALGHDDLRHILSSLNQLVSALLRVVHRYQQTLNNTSRKKNSQLSLNVNPKYTTVVNRLKKTTVLQIRFMSFIDIINNLDEWNKLAAIGPVFDHIAALRGPISQFYQAIQNGFELTLNLYGKINKEAQLETHLDHLLQQTESVLKQMPLMIQPHHFFTPVREDSAERLEQRASIKRLGHFFNH